MYVVLITVAALFIGPFLILLSSATKPAGQDVFGFPPDLIPRPPVTDWFREAWTTIPYARFLVNSLIYVGITVPIYLVVSALTAYPLARIAFRGRGLFFMLFLSIMFLPGELMLIPRFLVMSQLGLTDTFASVILPANLSSLGIFLLRQAFSQIPDEIIEAARVDGANEFAIFWRIAVPIVGPTLAVLAILGFVSVWNSFIGRWSRSPVSPVPDRARYRVSERCQRDRCARPGRGHGDRGWFRSSWSFSSCRNASSTAWAAPSKADPHHTPPDDTVRPRDDSTHHPPHIAPGLRCHRSPRLGRHFRRPAFADALVYDSPEAFDAAQAAYLATNPTNNEVGLYAWGESYFMLGLLRMYEAYQDLKYLQTFEQRAAHVLATTDKARGVTDYRGGRARSGAARATTRPATGAPRRQRHAGRPAPVRPGRAPPSRRPRSRTCPAACSTLSSGTLVSPGWSPCVESRSIRRPHRTLSPRSTTPTQQRSGGLRSNLRTSPESAPAPCAMTIRFQPHTTCSPCTPG